MTLPEELVTAVVEALMVDHEWDAMARASREVAQEIAEKDARIAVAAVLRALPESEAAAQAIAGALVNSWNEKPYVGQVAMEDAYTAVAAIARLADDD